MKLLPTFWGAGIKPGVPSIGFDSGDGGICPPWSVNAGRTPVQPHNRSRESIGVDFLWAGASALLLLCANLFPLYWLLSCVALIPLLNKIIKAGPGQALRLGAFFGISFFGVSLIDLCIVCPLTALAKFAGGTILFALFGWAVAVVRRRWGFNPLLIALFWVILDLGIIKLGFPNGLLAEGKVSNPLFGGMAALFGFLSISFLIVLFDSLLIIAFEAVAALGTGRESGISHGERIWGFPYFPRAITFQFFVLPQGRAPPQFGCFPV